MTLSRFTADPFATPSVAEVHESVDGSGLEVSGWFSTNDQDSEDEAFIPGAFSAAIPAAMAVGLPLLYHHIKTEPPIGEVKSIEERPGGLWGSVVIPRPAAGTRAATIYEALRQKLPLFFSVGGLWSRRTIAGKVFLGCKRLIEISLTSAPANVNARMAGVQAVSGVKSIGGVWVPDSFPAEWNAAVNAHRLRDLARDVELTELALDIASAVSG
jgi:HK97 family phage prohead protease